jgi:hypothetical protein
MYNFPSHNLEASTLTLEEEEGGGGRQIYVLSAKLIFHERLPHNGFTSKNS